MRHAILVRTIVVAVLFAAIIAVLEMVDDGQVLDRNYYFIAAIAVASAVALPWRAAATYLSLWLLVCLAIRSLNDAKISLTEMPLTFLDLRIAAANPSGFLGAMKISPLVVVCAGAGLATVVVGLMGWRLSRLHWPEVRRNVVPRAIAVAASVAFAASSMTLLARRLEAAVMSHEYSEIANMPDGLLLIAEKIGAVPFLALTARYDAATASPFHDLATAEAATPPAPDRLPILLNALEPPKQAPDIVVVLLESTFDLPKVFDVTPELRSELLPNASRGQLQGELGVNAIGGGTWISEFEAITGIPSRLFGYAGYYTHVELAPYVRGSLATWLKARGYQTLGLYPVEGQFYAARAAYGRYGFDSFHDGVELGIGKPWYAEDTDIMQRYIGVLEKADASTPMFAFALTMENHSPHPCTRFGGEAEMPYRFVAASGARGTCELNEYIARFRSTETAIAMLEAWLREREKKTGRPYVLAVFGDHQPNSFTGTSKSPFWSPYDYSALRRASNDVTFYQIRSSAPSPFAVAKLDASIVMLPTLVSAYVASSSNDVYLPANFGIQARCGEKISLPRLNAAYGKDAMIPAGEPNSGAPIPLSQTCRSALVAARPDYLNLIDMP